MTASPATDSTPIVTDAAMMAKLRAQRVQLARTNIGTFIEFVMRDEQTGAPIVLCEMHEEFHRLIDQHPRLVLHAFVEAGKTSSITVARALFELGKDPSKRIAIISNVSGQSQKILGSIAQYIEHSAELREVFPDLKPGSKWSSTAITVKRRTISKDPSVQAFGIHGAVIGSRLDIVISDDALDYENTRTQEQRSQTLQWFDSTVLGRVVAGGRVIVLGSAWHPEDLMMILAARRAAWAHALFAIEGNDGLPRWPERWPADRIAAKRQELGPLEAARQLDCRSRADETSRFREEWIVDSIERAQRSRLTAERGDTGMIPFLMVIPKDHFTICGVDLGVSQKSTADLSAISTIMVYPDGHRELLNVESGRWSAPEIIQRIIKSYQRYQPQRIVVESVAAQAYISSIIRLGSAIPITDYKTGSGKMSLQWQAEALAVELANGKWVIRGAASTEVQALIRDLLYWSPKEHTGDRLASLLFARWGCTLIQNSVEFLNADQLGLGTRR